MPNLPKGLYLLLFSLQVSHITPLLAMPIYRISCLVKLLINDKPKPCKDSVISCCIISSTFVAHWASSLHSVNSNTLCIPSKKDDLQFCLSIVMFQICNRWIQFSHFKNHSHSTTVKVECVAAGKLVRVLHQLGRWSGCILPK